MPNPDLITHQAVQPEKLRRAQELRRNMTPAEQVLWQKLRANRLDGWHFRRQQVIVGFIVDFYCNPARLAVEVDGPVHLQQAQADQERDQALAAAGVQVLRLTNDQVLNDLPSALAAIRQALAVRSDSIQGANT